MVKQIHKEEAIVLKYILCNNQLFGLDFMIDDNFKLWLIEANTNPCLELSCPLLSRIIPTMVENLFRYRINNI